MAGHVLEEGSRGVVARAGLFSFKDDPHMPETVPLHAAIILNPHYRPHVVRPQTLAFDCSTGDLQKRQRTGSGWANVSIASPVCFAVDFPSAQTGFRAFIVGTGEVLHTEALHLGCPTIPASPGFTKAGKAAQWSGFTFVSVAGKEIGGHFRFEVEDEAADEGLSDLYRDYLQRRAAAVGQIPVVQFTGPLPRPGGSFKPGFTITSMIPRPLAFGARLDGG